jgi:hypothetical protein
MSCLYSRCSHKNMIEKHQSFVYSTLTLISFKVFSIASSIGSLMYGTFYLFLSELLGKLLKADFNPYTQKSVGLDPWFGSSNFGVCITELVDGMINVLHAEEYPRPDFNQMIAITIKLLDEYDIRFDNRCRIFVDGANPSFIRALKEKVNEDSDYKRQISFYRKNYPSVYDLEFLQQNMFVIPVPVSKEHKHRLAHSKELMEYQNGYMAINPRFNKLITSLRTAVEYGEGVLDKEATSHDDLMDAFRLSLQFWH